MVNYLEPIFEKKFIFHSYACRKEKGTHKNIDSLKKFLSPQPSLYYFQTDIQSFFTSIDKNILISLVNCQVKRKEILWLAKTIILQNPINGCIIHDRKNLLRSIPEHKSLFYMPTNKGLPIGNLTSQFFANLYLNELDQFVKHKLKCRYYFRYMDDMIILHPDKSQLLEWRKEISHFLKQNLKLKLHPKKQTIQPVAHGIDFLGYIIKPEYLLSRRRVVGNLKRKLHYFNKLLDKKAFLPNLNFIRQTQATVNSYYGHFRHANCFHLKRGLYSNYFKGLKKFLEPADKKYSHFIVPDSAKKLYRSNKRDY